jgi:thiamine monophosphate kinase
MTQEEFAPYWQARLGMAQAEAVAAALDAVHARVRLTLIGGDTEQRYTPTEVSAMVGAAIGEVRGDA